MSEIETAVEVDDLHGIPDLCIRWPHLVGINPIERMIGVFPFDFELASRPSRPGLTWPRSSAIHSAPNGAEWIEGMACAEG
jgi:hypothetical protein